MKMNRGEYQANNESAKSLRKKVVSVVAASMTAGCAVPWETVKPVEHPIVDCGQSCRYELAVEQDIPQIEETQSFKLLTSMAGQLGFRFEEEDFVPCYVRVDGKPHLFFNRDGFHSGALALGVSAPSSFISDGELKQAQDRVQMDLTRRTGISITLSGDATEKKLPSLPQDFLVSDPVLGISFDAGLLSSTVSLKRVFQGMPDAFSRLSTDQKLNLVVPLLERETLKVILFPGIVKKGNSLMGPGPETALGRYKEDLAKRGESSTPDFTTYFALDPIDYDVSTLLAHTVAGSYGHGIPDRGAIPHSAR